MSSGDLLSKQACNWIRVSLALQSLKEGIEDITEAVATNVHDDLKEGLDVQACSACSPTDIHIVKKSHRRKYHMNCPVCDAWLQVIIVSKHGSQHLHVDNTNPQLWPTDPWEVLICYMGHGCQKIHSAKDADIQNILTLIKNCLPFRACGQIGRIDLVNELLKIRNSLFHSGDYLVSEKKLQADIQTMLDFMDGVTPESLVQREAVTAAMIKIKKLRNSVIHLTPSPSTQLNLNVPYDGPLQTTVHQLPQDDTNRIPTVVKR